MSKVTPLTESGKIAARWQAEDEAFAEQIGKIQKANKMTKEAIAAYLGITIPTMEGYVKCPDKMPKKVERRLVLLAEKAGIEYDPALGDGRKKKENIRKEMEALSARVTAIEKRMLLAEDMTA